MVHQSHHLISALRSPSSAGGGAATTPVVGVQPPSSSVTGPPPVTPPSGGTSATGTSKPGRINKADISRPSPLLLPPRMGSFASDGTWVAPPPSGRANEALDAHVAAHQPPARRPFDPTFLDVSASQVGVNDRAAAARTSPEHRGDEGSGPSTGSPAPARKCLTLLQYQSLLQSFTVFEKQLRSLAIAGDHLVRSLEELGDCAEASPDSVLGSLIDCTRLLSNTHTTWSHTLEREVERPYAKNIAIIQSNVASRLKSNELTIQTLAKHLQNEEITSYKSAKKGSNKASNNDIHAMTTSLNTRVKLTQEIQRIQQQNVQLPDVLAHEHLEFIVSRMDRALKSQLIAYDLMMEGLKKLDLQLVVEDGDVPSVP